MRLGEGIDWTVPQPEPEVESDVIVLVQHDLIGERRVRRRQRDEHALRALGEL